MVEASGATQPAQQPSAMITLLIQDLREDDKFHHIECESDSTVEDLKCLINIESQVEVEKQELFFR